MRWLLAWLAACGPVANPGPSPSPSGLRSSPAKESVVPFDCANAAAALGHPDAAVQACAEMEHLPGVFSVMLKGPQGFVSRIVVTDEKRQITTERGPAFAGRFLDRHQVDRSAALTLNEILFALDAAGGLPPGFDAAATGSIDVPGVDRSRLALGPLRLVLVRELVGGGPAPSGVTEPRYERATLQRGSGGWSWAIEAWTGSGWRPTSDWPLR